MELAFYIYPLPEGTAYTEDDLKDEKNVEILFDYCQILEAFILPCGWKFLFDTYGMSGLIKINKVSGWFNEVDEVEAEFDFIYHARSSGYDPLTDSFGCYNSETGEFTSNVDLGEQPS